MRDWENYARLWWDEGGKKEPTNAGIPCKHNFRSYAKNNAFKWVPVKAPMFIQPFEINDSPRLAVKYKAGKMKKYISRGKWSCNNVLDLLNMRENLLREKNIKPRPISPLLPSL